MSQKKKKDRREDIEAYIKHCSRNVEAMIYATEDDEELSYLATLFFLRTKDILTSLHGDSKARQILHKKLDELEITG